ncbi:MULTISPECIES: phosphatase [unclassified Arcicella]|uniref:Ppx/GppA phosphatase family protein n=1 Tax=unclassified Arcicella TaxID=2644986 RepID=UPI00285C04D2|nr:MULTISPECIES: phosphatase [unclassified Arcicella]MDR6562931.1 exopolyphosphatase/guanosine-5'-triphosphate,3'-diphosphate pyrophosphatase [Arcicella sp. BE51]MDR6813014.1 exopolyphosphatase/guanosine-5'-triphosphate,3'-diphosphate pyrophosphatase [Arcicella sp. BE140]MDR6824328.1 exopolyphosphatase/guanosine-5'-triphosphate,3'-diphosphate pyrophosphatase [Arcicella sp. BE139]
MKIAAIDIGSNAARMQISRVLENDGKISFKKVEYVRFALRLGHDVFNDGEISPESEVRIFKLLNAYKLLLDLHEVKDYMICATSAMREAGNAEAVITRIHKILDMKINIIEGAKEAELINDVVVQALDDANYLHIDVGGGSTELNIYSERKKIASKSFKIGSVRLLEHKEKEGDWDKMRRWIESNIDVTTANITAVGTGGNISKLFNISPNHQDATSISYEELVRLKNYVASFTYEERINKLRLNADRADVIVPAAQIYLSAMECAGAKKIFVPDLGLKDGIIQMVYERIQHRKK